MIRGPVGLRPPFRAALTLGIGSALLAGSVSAQERPEPPTAVLGVSLGSGARALGMGGAFIAIADDATASSWNPAGLAVLEKPEASIVWKGWDRKMLDVAPRLARIDSRAGQVTTVKSEGALYSFSAKALDFISATYPTRVRGLKLVPQFSYQRAIDLGHRMATIRDRVAALHSETSAGSEGAFTTSAFADRSTGGIDVWAASLGVILNPKLSLGASLNWWRKGSTQTSATEVDEASCQRSSDSCMRFLLQESDDLQRTFDGFNLNLGVLVRPRKNLRLGAVYKTPFVMNTLESLTYQSEQITRISEPTGQRGGTRSEGAREQRSGRIRWPRTLGAGVAIMPRELLTLSADFTTTSWSGVDQTYSGGVSGFVTFQDAGDGRTSLVDSYDKPKSGHLLWPTLLEVDRAERVGRERQAGQNDTYEARLGMEYVIVRKRMIVPVRAGAFYDRQYFTDRKRRPVWDWGWTAGSGLIWSGIALDLAYVQQSTAFSRDYLVSPDIDPRGRRIETNSAREDRLSSHKIYVSAIVRF
jgi:long-subunit fatty acid transport protein